MHISMHSLLVLSQLLLQLLLLQPQNLCTLIYVQPSKIYIVHSEPCRLLSTDVAIVRLSKKISSSFAAAAIENKL